MSLLTKLIEAKKTFSIIELGCGIPVAHSFMLQSGSSRVLTMAACPYSRDYQTEMTGIDLTVTRSISVEMVQELLDYLANKGHNESFHIAYSVQAGSSAKICHGYMGIRMGKNVAIYHITLGVSMPKDIAGICMMALVEDMIEYHVLSGTRSVVDGNGTSRIDGAWSNSNFADLCSFDASLLPDNFGTFCWASGQWYRTVDIFRQLEGGLCLIKGSFNPLHDGHKQLIHAASEFTNIPLLCMTTRTIDGKYSYPIGLIDRANSVPGSVFVIDSRNVYMRELIADITRWEDTAQRNIHLFMGIDVFAKFDVSDVNEDVKIHVYHRQCSVNNISFNDSKYADLSSTLIRGNEANKPTI